MLDTTPPSFNKEFGFATYYARSSSAGVSVDVYVHRVCAAIPVWRLDNLRIILKSTRLREHRPHVGKVDQDPKAR